MVAMSAFLGIHAEQQFRVVQPSNADFLKNVLPLLINEDSNDTISITTPTIKANSYYLFRKLGTQYCRVEEPLCLHVWDQRGTRGFGKEMTITDFCFGFLDDLLPLDLWTFSILRLPFFYRISIDQSPHSEEIPNRKKDLPNPATTFIARVNASCFLVCTFS